MGFCECWCGEQAKLGRKFIHGHNARGKKMSEDAKKLLSERRRGFGNPMYGKHHTKDWIEKHREKMVGNINGHRTNCGKQSEDNMLLNFEVISRMKYENQEMAKEKRFCKCGCGSECNRDYVNGHNARGVKRKRSLNYCMCGCGEQCRNKWKKDHYLKRKNKSETGIIFCITCGNSLNNKIRKFCSAKCFQNKPSKNLKPCQWCKEKTKNRVFCSNTCKGEASRGKTLEEIGWKTDSIVKMREVVARINKRPWEERYGEEKAKQYRIIFAERLSKRLKGKRQTQEHREKIAKNSARFRIMRPTKIEKILFKMLTSMFSEVEVIREYKVDRFYIDCALPDLKIACEADGSYWHVGKEDYDLKRDDILKGLGWNVYRFSDSFLNKYDKSIKR